MIGLFLIGMPLTIIVLYMAYHIGSKKEETKEWRWNDME
jgi:hypothetical protein